jgi:hypothetical protein
MVFQLGTVMKSFALIVMGVSTLLASASSRGQNVEQVLDTTFGTDGRRTIAFDAGGDNRDVAVDAVRTPAGDVYVVGEVQTANGKRVGISKLTFSGALDTSFGSGGKLVLDLCMDVAVRDAEFNGSTFFILGETLACGSGGTIDGRMAKLNLNGTLDTSFDGDGLISFPLVTGENTEDRVWRMHRNPITGELIVAASVRLANLNNREVPIALRFNGSGALVNRMVGPGFTEDSRFTDVKRANIGSEGYTFAVYRLGSDLASSGGIYRMDNSLMPVQSFGTAGFVGVRESNTQVIGCSSGSDLEMTELVVMGTEIYLLGSDPFLDNFAFAMVNRDGNNRITECGGPRIDEVKATFVDTINETGKIYLGGSCAVSTPSGVSFEMCVAAVRQDFSQNARLIIDPSFNPNAGDQSQPLRVGFTAASNETPFANARFIMRTGSNRTLIGGERRWSFNDRDFAVAQFRLVPSLLRNGFE